MEVIGHTSSAENDVRRRQQTELGWSTLRRSDELFQADSVFTGEGSRTELSLDNQTKVILAPDSLVSLYLGQGKTQIELKRGGVSGLISSHEELSVSHDGRVARVSGDHAQVAIVAGAEGALRALVLSGKATVRTNQSALALQESQEAMIPSDGGAPVMREFRLAPLAPAWNAVLWRGAADPLELSWKGVNGLSSYRIEIYDQAGDPMRPIATQEVSGTSAKFADIPPKGSYAWRVIGQDKPGGRVLAESPLIRFSSVSEIGPSALGPLRGAERLVARKMGDDEGGAIPGGDVRFSWSELSDVRRFQIEISRNLDFASPEVTETVEGTEFRRRLGLGDHYWRVKAVDLSRPSAPWSAVSVVSVRSDFFASPPGLTGAGEARTMIVPQQEGEIAFEWKPVERAKAYSVEVSRDPGFPKSGILWSRKLDSTSVQARLPSPATYFWRVRAIGDQEAVSDYTETQKLILIKKPPLPAPSTPKGETEYELKSGLDPEPGNWISRMCDFLIPAAEAQEHEQGLELRWNPIAGAVSYRIEISAAKDFAQIILKGEARDSVYEWSAPAPGVYYWRVAAVDSDGDAGEMSEPGAVRVVVAPPKPSAPREVKEEFSDWELFKKYPATVRLSWGAVRYAKKFEVQIGDHPGLEKADRLESTENQIEVRLASPGLRYWRVRALDDRGAPIGKFSKATALRYTRTFTLLQPKGEPRRGEAVFVWQPVSSSARYEVEISKSPSFDEIVRSLTTADSHLPEPEGLPHGKVYWRVRAQRDGYLSQWSEPLEVDREAPLRGSSGLQTLLGVSSFSYSETASSDYSMFSVLAALRYSTALGASPWGVSGEVFSTLATLSSNLSGSNCRVTGGDASFGYAFPNIASPWELEAGAGGFYRTMSVSDEQFGFHNMYGPLLSLHVARRLSAHQIVRGYGRFGFALPRGVSPSLNDHELGTGISWVHSAIFSFPLILSLDYSKLALNFADVLFMNSTAISLTLGTAW